jgi:hypothetical protein
MPQDLHPEALRLGETEYHLHLFIVDFLLFDYACANPGEYVCDRRGNEVTSDHLHIPPAYSSQSEYNPWGTYGTVTF